MYRPSGEAAPMPHSPAHIEITWSADPAELAPALLRLLPGDATTPLPIVPSSLRQADPVVAGLRANLRERGTRSMVWTPRTAAAALVRRREATPWSRITVENANWRVDRRLADGRYVVLTTVDAASRGGPFVLDLPGRFLHPADRIRLAARPDRLRLLADIAAAALPIACLVVTPVAGGLLTVATRDPIAAELWALALAERYHDAALEMQGPWEEPAVQRATELGLGIRIPRDMAPRIVLAADATEARDVLQRSLERLGIESGPV
jgi:hypothetical protein